MKRSIISLAMLLVACTSPSYPGIDRPSTDTDNDNQDIIDYIDKRLEEEYYWLDEVAEKSDLFNRRLAWEEYLDAALLKLSTNGDDGYTNSRGQRIFYSYIHEIPDFTRSQTTGFGIELHYTIAVIDKDNGNYGFIVENVFDDSPAKAADMRRGDVITQVNGEDINSQNYVTLFNTIQNNSASSLRLQYRRQSDGESYAATLSGSTYTPSTVAYSDILNIEGYDSPIGYLVYTGFESEYDEELLAAIGSFATAGVKDVILDLRCNGGGALSSAIKLASALLPAEMEGKTLCSVKRNPKNLVGESEQTFNLENCGAILSLPELTVICSDNSASASELIVMGLRGLDIPVKLIGSTTEGKNCGMDVSRRKVGNKYVEYAPITFMCFNAKGFGDWGEGIAPDVDLTTENIYGVKDANYPLPRCAWGDMEHDIALISAVASVTGKSVGAKTRAVHDFEEMSTTELARSPKGILLYTKE